MGKCIICRTNELKTYASEEHIFPDCIGGTIKTYLVCENYNSKLGDKIDGEFTQQPLIKALRRKYNIKNRDGIVPSNTTKDFGWKDGRGESVIIGPNGILEPPKVEIKKSNNKIDVNFLGSDKKAIITSLNREAKRQGINITFNDKEDSPNKAKSEIENRELTTVLKFDEIKMQNLCLKIAFEMASEKYGDSYLTDKIGMNIQKDLYNLLYHDIVIDYSKYSIENKFLNLNETSSHHDCAFIENNNLSIARINLFNAFLCYILVSDNARNLSRR